MHIDYWKVIRFFIVFVEVPALSLIALVSPFPDGNNTSDKMACLITLNVLAVCIYGAFCLFVRIWWWVFDHFNRP